MSELFNVSYWDFGNFVIDSFKQLVMYILKLHAKCVFDE